MDALPEDIETLLVHLVESDLLDDKSARIVRENFRTDPRHYRLLLESIAGEVPPAER